MLSLITTSLLAISLNSTTSISDYIYARALAHDYSPVKAQLIAKCESEFIATAKSKTSSAGGIFQFLNGTWIGVMKDMGLPTTTPKTDPHYNIEAGLYLLDKEGDRHWNASKSCWLPKYQEYLNGMPDKDT